MFNRVQQLFVDNGIEVVIGASGGVPEELASAYLQDTLQTGSNI